MRILISAYSCEPGRGSEPGVGWNTAVELSRRHDVWVVTKTRHRRAIEQELAQRPVARLHFVYYDVPPGLGWSSREGPLVQLHYYLWQYLVYPVARRLNREIGFDVAYHATFGRYWSPSLFALLPIPFVWGAVGGGEVVSPAMRRSLGLKGRAVEYLKAVAFGLYRFDPFVRLTARRAALVLTTEPAAARKIAGLGARRLEHMEATAVDRAIAATIDTLEEPPPRNAGEPVCYATLSRLLPWKGVHLALHAFQQLGDPRARYLIVGEGPARKSLERLAVRLGISGQVEFKGNPSRLEWMRILKQCHALVHPALSNTFNTIVLESMVCARPVICFEADGIVDWLGRDTSYIVEAPNPERAVARLAEAMRQVATEPAVARQRGMRARERALRLFTWDPRTVRLNHHFDQVVTATQTKATADSDAPPPRASAKLLYLEPPPTGGQDRRARSSGV